MTTRASAPHTPSHPDRRNDDLEQQRRALIERATADELGAELEALALQAEAVLHRLRNGRMH
jgi:hypothetical protein